MENEKPTNKEDFIETFIEDMRAYLQQLTPEKRAALDSDDSYIKDAEKFFAERRKTRERSSKKQKNS